MQTYPAQMEEAESMSLPEGCEYPCQSCGRSFSKKSKLSRHIRESHVGEKSFACLICQKKFKRNSHLKRHMVSHSSQPKPFSCSQCSMSFACKHHLERHIKTLHAHEFPFQCELCFLRFPKRASLFKHLTFIHNLKKPHKCLDCEKDFFKNGQLIRHLKRVHPHSYRAQQQLISAHEYQHQQRIQSAAQKNSQTKLEGSNQQCVQMPIEQTNIPTETATYFYICQENGQNQDLERTQQINNSSASSVASFSASTPLQESSQYFNQRMLEKYFEIDDFEEDDEEEDDEDDDEEDDLYKQGIMINQYQEEGEEQIASLNPQQMNPIENFYSEGMISKRIEIDQFNDNIYLNSEPRNKRISIQKSIQKFPRNKRVLKTEKQSIQGQDQTSSNMIGVSQKMEISEYQNTNQISFREKEQLIRPKMEAFQPNLNRNCEEKFNQSDLEFSHLYFNNDKREGNYQNGGENQFPPIQINCSLTSTASVGTSLTAGEVNNNALNAVIIQSGSPHDIYSRNMQQQYLAPSSCSNLLQRVSVADDFFLSSSAIDMSVKVRPSDSCEDNEKTSNEQGFFQNSEENFYLRNQTVRREDEILQAEQQHPSQGVNSTVSHLNSLHGGEVNWEILNYMDYAQSNQSQPSFINQDIMQMSNYFFIDYSQIAAHYSSTGSHGTTINQIMSDSQTVPIQNTGLHTSQTFGLPLQAISMKL